MVLDHYGWVRQLKGTGNTVRSCCPIHNGTNDKQFVVNIQKNAWTCFGDCRKGGSILELVAALEKIEIREAAVRIASWFPLSLPHSSARSSIVMSDTQKPTYKVFVVEERGEGDDADAFWTRVGSTWDGQRTTTTSCAARSPSRSHRSPFFSSDSTRTKYELTATASTFL